MGIPMEVEPNEGFRVTEVTEDTVLRKIFALRVTAWRQRFTFPSDIQYWKDDYDKDALHWAILVDDEPIAAARLTLHSRVADVPDAYIYGDTLPYLASPICSMNRCVVHPYFRNKKLSRLLDETRITAARKKGATCIVVTVDDERRADSLESSGFVRIGMGLPYVEGFLAGIPNVIYLMNL